MSSNKRIVTIVDDDVYIAQLFHEALSENIDGISVCSFNDPIMAFEHFLKNKENCALVISDLRMPRSKWITITQKSKGFES